MKTLMSKAEIRTNEALLLAIEDAVSQVTQKDATHRFTYCGFTFYLKFTKKKF